MRILITLLIFLPTALLAQDRAKDILDNVSQKTSSYSTIEAHFTNSIVSKTAGINESQKGKLFLQGDFYRLEMESQTLISDGENNWIHLLDEKEVQIIEIDEDEENITPSKMFTLYQDGYRCQFISETSSDFLIDLIPEESGSFIKIELKINKQEMRVSSFIMHDKNGGQYSYVISLFKANQVFDQKLFTFDPSAHPGVDVIDLR